MATRPCSWAVMKTPVVTRWGLPPTCVTSTASTSSTWTTSVPSTLARRPSMVLRRAPTACTTVYRGRRRPSRAPRLSSRTAAWSLSPSRQLSDQRPRRSEMTLIQSLMVSALSLAVVAAAHGAVSPEQAAQLGQSLTAVGAEQAGNADGSIPAYNGGLTTPPSGFQAGSTMRVDPFAEEKPRLVIDGKSVAEHADKLTVTTQELLKRFPSYRLDVYPTHRTVALPQRLLDNTRKNATAARTTDEGLALENVLPGVPFPIPNDGF